jgi:hypothetical protein
MKLLGLLLAVLVLHTLNLGVFVTTLIFLLVLALLDEIF